MINSRRALEAGLAARAHCLDRFLRRLPRIAFSAHGGFFSLDSANLVVHEGGHNLFGCFGDTIGLWGGTLLEWLVPFVLLSYFLAQRQVAGFVFCLFFFLENWLYTATHMADARARELALVTSGDADFVEHDFHAIFSQLGVLALGREDCGGGADSGLVRDAGLRWVAGVESSFQVRGSNWVTRRTIVRGQKPSAQNSA